MKHILEIMDMAGDYISDEEHSLLESETAITVPNVGDEILLPDSGPGNQFVKVVHRVFLSLTTKTTHIQTICKKSET